MLKILWNGWLSIAKRIGYVQSRIAMTIIYFVVLAPFALAIRLFSDPLALAGTRAWHPITSAHPGGDRLPLVQQQF